MLIPMQDITIQGILVGRGIKFVSVAKFKVDGKYVAGDPFYANFEPADEFKESLASVKGHSLIIGKDYPDKIEFIDDDGAAKVFTFKREFVEFEDIA